jgi:hypothetical protein
MLQWTGSYTLRAAGWFILEPGATLDETTLPPEVTAEVLASYLSAHEELIRLPQEKLEAPSRGKKEKMP